MTKPLEISPNEYHSRLKVNRANIFDADSYLSKSVIWELKQASLYRCENAQKQVVLLNKVKLPGYDEINLKALVDLAPTSGSYLVDIKTTNTVTPLALSKKTAELGYHAQAGIYLKLWNLCFPDDQRDRFIFIWQCSEPPYEVCVSELPAADIYAGEEWIAFQLERLANATKTNTWPDPFLNQVAVIGRPEWAGYQDEEEYDGIIPAPAHC